MSIYIFLPQVLAGKSDLATCGDGLGKEVAKTIAKRVRLFISTGAASTCLRMPHTRSAVSTMTDDQWQASRAEIHQLTQRDRANRA
jgi:hypothetical protein